MSHELIDFSIKRSGYHVSYDSTCGQYEATNAFTKDLQFNMHYESCCESGWNHEFGIFVDSE